MDLKELVLTITKSGDDWYSKEHGSHFDFFFPVPPLDHFVKFTESVLFLHLTGGSEADIESLFFAFRQNNNPGFQNDYRGTWTSVVAASATLSDDPRLENVPPFRGDLRFYGDLRVFIHNRSVFCRGPKGTAALPAESLRAVRMDDEEITGEIIDRTGSSFVRIALPWIGDRAVRMVPGGREKSGGPYDVFLSHRSLDFPLAKQVYDYLTEKGKKVFLSEVSLPALGSADYTKKIDEALESSTHLILVGSSVDNIKGSWVEAEWRVFINEKRSGRKSGNIVTVFAGDLTFAWLPISLRYYEAMPFQPESFEKLLAYVT